MPPGKHKAFVLLAAFLAAFIVWGSSGADAASGNKPSAAEVGYEACLRRADYAPAEALRDAQGWVARGGGDAAVHCAAVALARLGRFEEAAKRLESLAWGMAATTPDPVRATLLAQAGRAWIEAGQPTKADTVLLAAVDLAPQDPEIRIDHGTALIALGRYQDAVIALTAALISRSDATEALVLRAKAYRSSGRIEEAAEDVARALRLVPDAPDALLERGTLRRLQGDLGGARADWGKIAMRHPGSPAGIAAKRALELLDRRPETERQP